MADALDPDPHGTRGSTVHHALDYKKEVKKFSSADILNSFKAAQRGEVVPVKTIEGGGGSSSSSSAAVTGPPPESAAPRPPANSEFSSEAEKRKLAQGVAQGAAGAASAASAVEQARAVQAQKVRSWIDEPNEPKSGDYDLTGLKDALAATDISDPQPGRTNKVAPTTTPAAPPPNLLDLDLGAPPTAPPSAFAPTSNSEWASLESTPPPGASAAAAIHSIDLALARPAPAGPPPGFANMPPPAGVPPGFASMPPPAGPPPGFAAMPPPAGPPPGFAGMPPPAGPPNMPPPNMPPPNMPPPNMPPPNMPPPAGPPPGFGMPPPSGRSPM
jgi:hypothetical protein